MKPLDLLPCPFCGGRGQARPATVSCLECRALVDKDTWNRRSPPVPTQHEREPGLTIQEVIDEASRRAGKMSRLSKIHDDEGDADLMAAASQCFSELVNLKVWIEERVQEATPGVTGEDGANGGAEGTDIVGSGAPRRTAAQIQAPGSVVRSEHAKEPAGNGGASSTPWCNPVSSGDGRRGA